MILIHSCTPLKFSASEIHLPILLLIKLLQKIHKQKRNIIMLTLGYKTLLKIKSMHVVGRLLLIKVNLKHHFNHFEYINPKLLHRAKQPRDQDI